MWVTEVGIIRVIKLKTNTIFIDKENGQFAVGQQRVAVGVTATNQFIRKIMQTIRRNQRPQFFGERQVLNMADNLRRTSSLKH